MIVAALVVLLLSAGTPALTTGGYGHVDFANSGSPAAQAPFLEGLALLHDFEYTAAASAFRRAQAADPGFAMAFWGEAMTYNHPIWMQQDRDAALAALARLAPSAAERRAKARTEREKGYLDAVEILYGEGSKPERDFRYEAAMEKLHASQPQDVDAAAFYGLAILGTAHAGRDVPTYMRAAGVLEEAWVDHREHPGLLHYLIHSYDDPTHAPLGLRAARLYARIAPDAGHAQHMTSHIFLALGMWPETVSANLAGIADATRMRAAQGQGPVRCGHYPSWLAYAYLQLGRASDARAALEGCRAALAEQDAKDPHQAQHGASVDPDASPAGSYANMRLRYLVDTDDWTGDVASWPAPASAGPGARLDLAFAQAWRTIALGSADAARQSVGDLEAAGRAVAELQAQQADPDPSYRRRPEILLLEARALLAEHQGDVAEAERLLRQATAAEDALPIAFGPPTIDKPTHELLGELLARHGHVDAARLELETALARAPGRRRAVEKLATLPPAAPPR